MQININKLCSKSDEFKIEFIKLLKKLPVELRDLYGYDQLI